MPLDGVTSFSRIKTYEIHVNASVTVKVLSGSPFHVMSESLKHLKDRLAYTSFPVC